MHKETLYLLLAYISTCSSGNWWEENTNGVLTPMDPEVCTTWDVTFTCTLLDSPKINYSIGFAIKNESTGDVQVAVDNVHVISVNATMSQFTIYNISLETKTSDVYLYVQCYYWQAFGDMDSTLKLGEPSSAHITPKPIAVQSFKCVLINYDRMNCTWEFGKDYGNHLPELFFQWSRTSYPTSWKYCPSNDSIKEGYCYWNIIKDGIINITLSLNQACGENVTSEFQIETSEIVKPNPVVDLTAVPVNSTCIMVSWSSSDSKPHNPKEHKVTMHGKWENKTTQDGFTTTSEEDENIQHSLTFCELHPNTNYTFLVSIRAVGNYSGDFSDEREVMARTLSAKPSASPEVTEGGFSWQSQECQENNDRRVCIFWKQIKEEDMNGQMKGLQVTFTAKNAPKDVIPQHWAKDTKYGCMLLMCRKAYIFRIKAENYDGTSENASTLDIPAVTPGLVRPFVIVEWANSSDVYISWSYPESLNAHGFTVAWCRNNNGDCENTHEVNWEKFSSNTTHTIIQIDSSYAARDMLYGVSALTDHVSTGMDWQDCVYQKDAEPTRKPENVIVSKGAEDNTLIVTWDKLTCKPDQPYIDKYSIQYKNMKDGSQKSKDVTAEAEARLVLSGLKEDQPYNVTVRSITKDGRKGPKSDPQTGTPVNRSLKSEAIVGITMAALVCVIFAGVGCFCAIRRCKNKAKKVIKEAGNITIPDAGDLALNISFGRQDSKDSGYDMTPPLDECQDSAKFNKSVFFPPNDYHLVGSKEGMATDTSELDPRLLSPVPDKPCISRSAKELANKLLDSSGVSNCILEIPKPLAFIKSEGEISCDEKEVADSNKENSTNYVTTHKESSKLSKHLASKQNSHLNTQSAPENNLGTGVKNTVKACDILKAKPIAPIANFKYEKQENVISKDKQGALNSDYVTTYKACSQPSSKSIDISGTGSVSNISDRCPCKNEVSQAPTLNNTSIVLPCQKANTRVRAPECSLGYVTSVVDPTSKFKTTPSSTCVSDAHTLCCDSKTTNAIQNNALSQGNMSVNSTFNQISMPGTSLGHIHSTSIHNQSHSSPHEVQKRMLSSDNETFEPCYIGLQSGAKQGKISHSYSISSKNNSSPASDVHDNNGYIHANTMKDPALSRVVGSYVPCSRAVEIKSEKTGNPDLTATVAVARNTETSYVFPLQDTDFGILTITNLRSQSAVENVDDTIQHNGIPSVLNKSPEYPTYPVLDTQPQPISARGSTFFPDYVDESFADVPLKVTKDILNNTDASKPAESHDDGYLDHSALENLNGRLGVFSDTQPKSDQNAYIHVPPDTDEDLVPCSPVGNYILHQEDENISDKTGKNDTMAADNKNTNTNSVFPSPDTDYGIQTNETSQSDVKNRDNKLQLNDITSVISKSPELYQYPLSDAYVPLSLCELQPHPNEKQGMVRSHNYVDERCTDVPLNGAKGFVEKTSVEAQSHGYIGHFALENCTKRLNVFIDKEPQPDYYLSSPTVVDKCEAVESQFMPIISDGYTFHPNLHGDTRRATEPEKMEQKEIELPTSYIQSPQANEHDWNNSMMEAQESKGNVYDYFSSGSPLTAAFKIAQIHANHEKKEDPSTTDFDSGLDSPEHSPEIERKQPDIGNGYIQCNVAMSMQS